MTKAKYLWLAPAALFLGALPARADLVTDAEGIITAATTTFGLVAALSIVVVAFGITITMVRKVKK